MSIFEEEMFNRTTPDASGVPYNYWYVCVKQTLAPCLTSPYADVLDGNPVRLISLAVPVIENARFIGVVAIDINITDLQKQSQELAASLYAGKATVSVISNTGVVAANSSNEQASGKMADAVGLGSQQQFNSAETAGTTRSQQNGDTFQLLSSFEPLPGAAPWSVKIDVPWEVLMAPANTLGTQLDTQRYDSTFRLVGLGALLAIIGLALIALSTHKVFRPLKSITDMIREIAIGEGDLTKRIIYAQKNELGELTGWLNRFLDKLQPIVRDIQDAAQKTREAAAQASSSPVSHMNVFSNRLAKSIRWPPPLPKWPPRPKRSHAVPLALRRRRKTPTRQRYKPGALLSMQPRPSTSWLWG